MNRRKFVKDSLAVAGGTLATLNSARASAPENYKIEYIRPSIPAVEIPPQRGARYEDRVPDTLDMAERAKLGISCMTEIADPRADYEIHFALNIHRNPAVMSHDFNDWCQNVEGMIESLPLLRLASGSDQNTQVDKVWQDALLKSLGPDGLLYYPLNGTPWARINVAWETPVWKANDTTADARDKSVTQITNPNLWPKSIATMIIYHLRDNNPMWKQNIEQMIQGMYGLVTDQGDYCYFPAGGYEPGKKFRGGWGAGEQVMPIGYLALDGGNSRVIQGLAQYFRLTGYEPARTMAQKLLHYVRFRANSFDADGRYRCSAYEKGNGEGYAKYSNAHGGRVTPEEIRAVSLGGHFHSHAVTVLGAIEYATAVGDREVLDWCKSSYEWAKTQGNIQVGFFPEFILPEYPSCESCEVGDMIALALKLTRAGMGDYWDDANRWTRNQFAEQQLTDSNWIDRFAETQPAKTVAFNETTDRVGQRNVGGFAGWASGNEWSLRGGIMHCCTGTCTRSIYYVWESIVETKGDEFRVNLLLNRASPSADVYSFIPYSGKVDLKMKKSFRRILVRAPEWVSNGSPEVSCRVNGSPRTLAWEGRYVIAGAANPGDKVELEFPISTRRAKERLGTVDYNLEIRGNTVISIDPPGQFGPLYNRVQYQPEKVSWRTVKRFVSDETIVW